MMQSLDPSRDAPFYMLYDARGDEDLLENQFDQEGRVTRQPSKETQRIYAGRVALMERLDPSSPKGKLWQSLQYPVPPALVNRESWFNMRKPERIDHHEPVWCPNPYNINDMYMVVSSEWKTAIESVEPSVHEFFPHTLRFKNAAVSDRYVFRTRVVIRNCLTPDKMPMPEFDPFRLCWKDEAGRELRPEADLERIGAQNWATHIYSDGVASGLVSQRLATRLRPLLPRLVYLWPLSNRSASA